MTYRLADRVQVRQENWGLLFYSQDQHRMFFVRSGNWLHPEYFNGTWTFNRLINDIAGRTETTPDIIEQTLQKSIDNLVKNGMVVHELC